MRAVKCAVAAAVISTLMSAPFVALAQPQALQPTPTHQQNQRMPECSVKWKAYKDQNNVEGTDAFRAFMNDCLRTGASPIAASDDWKKFLNGQPFISTTSSNLQFRMTLTPNGKMTRDPMGAGGSKAEGTWTLSADEFCTAWAGAKPNCFVVRKKDENNWSLMRGSTEVAVWTAAGNPSNSTSVPTDPKKATSSSETRAFLSEFSALRDRLASLWSVPIDANNPDELVVKLRLKLKPDGILASPPLVLTTGSSPVYVAARDSAIRAVFSGQPYTMLKPESYEAWKDIEITFDARGITATSRTSEQAAQAETTAKAPKRADEAIITGDVVVATPQQLAATSNAPPFAASSKAPTPPETPSKQQTAAAQVSAPERASIAVNERDFDFSATGMILRSFIMHATLLIAACGQFILILFIVFRFSSPQHEKIMRGLAAACGLLIYVGTKAAGISIPDTIYRALSTSAISVGILGVLLPFAAGLLVAWYVVMNLNSRHPEQNVVGMRILSLVMTYVFFLYCDSYASYGANEKKEFVHLLPNFTFVLSMLLYAMVCYHPYGAGASAAGESMDEIEYPPEQQPHVSDSFGRRRPAAGTENARLAHRGPGAVAREHVSLASAIRTRVT